jgi:hypothetical protein
LLSPAIKTPPGRGEYLAKRNAILRQDVHLLELDLLLQGERMPLRNPLPPGYYYALLARVERRPDCDVYAWTLRDGLPTVPIPLRTPDADVLVDLAAAMRTIYKAGTRSPLITTQLPMRFSPHPTAHGSSGRRSPAIRKAFGCPIRPGAHSLSLGGRPRIIAA